MRARSRALSRSRSLSSAVSSVCAVWALCALFVLGLFGLPTDAYASDAAPDDVAGSVGASPSGLPGLARVAVASPRQLSHAGAALGMGYGFTEAQTNGVNESGAHHRAFGTLALMGQPLPFLAAALMLEGRYDGHPDDALGSSSSAVGEPRLIVRASERLGKSFALGAQLGLWIPGGEAPSLQPDASTLDAVLLGTFNPSGSNLALALNVGYRVDRSGQVLDARERPRLRSGDRLALHLSDFDAVLLGVGASKRLGAAHTSTSRIELLGELTWDVLVGEHAPKALESPLRLGLGTRYHVNEEDESFGAFQLEARTELALSSRPSSAPTDALVPIDPLVAVVFGVRWTPALGVKARRPDAARDGAAVAGGGPLPAPAYTLGGQITAEGGSPLANARVTLTSPDSANTAPRTADTGADGSFSVADVRAGRAHLVASAAGYEDASTEVTVGNSTETPLVKLVLKKAIKPGQLRGLVRSFTGKPLTATIRVEPIGVEGKTDADGLFVIDLPPGSYEVVVTATGYAGQRRPIALEENGVTILNADMRPGKDAP